MKKSSPENLMKSLYNKNHLETTKKKEGFQMKYFWYFIFGGLLGLLLSYIATEISRTVAFLTLGIVAVIAFCASHPNNSDN